MTCTDSFPFHDDVASDVSMKAAFMDDLPDSTVNLEETSVAASSQLKKRLRSEFETANGEDDLATKQRRRRQIRMEILRKKRLSKVSGNNLSCPSSDEESSSADSEPSPAPGTGEAITDPQLLRKLRNRESAARSRQKIIDLIDALSFDLMERYVKLKDLEDQLDFMANYQPLNGCSAPFVSPLKPADAYNSQYPSQINYEIIPFWNENLNNYSPNNSNTYSSNNNSSTDSSSCASPFYSSASSPFYSSASTSSEMEEPYYNYYNYDGREDLIHLETLAQEIFS